MRIRHAIRRKEHFSQPPHVNTTGTKRNILAATAHTQAHSASSAPGGTETIAIVTCVCKHQAPAGPNKATDCAAHTHGRPLAGHPPLLCKISAPDKRPSPNVGRDSCHAPPRQASPTALTGNPPRYALSACYRRVGVANPLCTFATLPPVAHAPIPPARQTPPKCRLHRTTAERSPIPSSHGSYPRAPCSTHPSQSQ